MAISGQLGVLLDHAQDKVILVEADGTITYANAATERLLDRPPASLVGHNAFDFVHPADVDEARSAFHEAIDAGSYTEVTCECRFEAADGTWVWLESRMSNVTDDSLDGYVVSSRDISDRVEAQRERAEAVGRLEELTETTGDVLWMFDADWSELLFVNPAYEDLFGQSEDRLRANPTHFLEAVHPDDRAAVQEGMESLSAGRSVDLEYRVDPRRDYSTWVWVQGEPILADGEVVRVAGFVRDVTDHHRRERQLYVMDNLLRHNLRNDLDVILGNAELIEAAAPHVADRTAVIRRTGEDLLESAEKERRIIELLTDRVETTEIDLGAAITESVEAVNERFPDARIETDVPPGTTVTAVDECAVALTELLENAIRHATRDRPRVGVRAESTGETVTVTVSDEVPPIPDMEAAVLVGGRETTDLYHSSGLGLWLVHWIVELSDGSITVTPGEAGNEIHLRLPTAD